MSQAKRGRMDDRMGEESSSDEEVTLIIELTVACLTP